MQGSEQLGFRGSEAERPLPARTESVVSVRPPGGSLPALPPSPFSKAGIPFGPGPARQDAAAALSNILSGDSPFTHSGQTKIQWGEDAHSPRQSGSDAHGAQVRPLTTCTSIAAHPLFNASSRGSLLRSTVSVTQFGYTFKRDGMPVECIHGLLTGR